MRLLNSNNDKFLIQCIELDVYDLLYKAHSVNPKWDLRKLMDETHDLLHKYVGAKAIKSCTYRVMITGHMKCVEVELYSPYKIKIKCEIP